MTSLAQPPRTPDLDAPQSPVNERTPCRHCGLTIGKAVRLRLGPFCCAGCKTVHELILGEGLERFYDLRPRAEAPSPRLRPDSMPWLEPLLERAEEGGELRRLELDVQGVHCAACVWLLQQLWSRHRGGVQLHVNPLLGRLRLLWRDGGEDLRVFLQSAERFGFRFGPVSKREPTRSRSLVVRMGICIAAALNTMIFSLCYYAGLGEGEGRLYEVLGWCNAVLALIAVAVGGSLFVGAAWQGLRRRVVHLDLPIAVGILLGFGGSTWAFVRHGPDAAYFDTITVFVALMLVGRWLQERVLLRNRLALLANDGVEHLYVRRFRESGEFETVRAAEVVAGDELCILPDDLIPVRARAGDPLEVDLAWITGESRTTRVTSGDVVPAGAFHVGKGARRVVAEEPFSASVLHELLEARGRSADTDGAREADPWWARVALLYVVAVLGLASAAFVKWWSAGAEQAIAVALSVLVVTCPCALGLAVPLAHELVHSALRRRGIFLCRQGFLRRALRVRSVLFDKTGTLTRASLRPTEDTARALRGLGEEDQFVLATACAHSNHPIARCVHEFLERERPGGWVEGLGVEEVAGNGLEARLGSRSWRFGHHEFALQGRRRNANDHGRSSLPRHDSTPGVDGRAGDSRGTCFASEGKPLCFLDFEEELRPDAADEVAALRAEGYRIHVLSGDRNERVRRVGNALGMDEAELHGELDPAAKAEWVRRIDEGGDTCMVGDGINDGPAFDAATCAATPAVDRPQLPSRADFYFLGDGIAAVRTAMAAARRLHRVVRANLVLAVAYNCVAVTLCMLGFVGPLTAAIAMPLSSVALVSWTSVRLAPGGPAWTS